MGSNLFTVKNVTPGAQKKRGLRNTKFRVANDGPFYYLKHTDQTDPTAKARNYSVNGLSNIIAGSYMANIITINVDPDNRIPGIEFGEARKSILRESRRILRYANSTEFKFKMVRGDVSLYCAISLIEDSPNGAEVGIIVIIHDNEDMITTGHMLLGSSSEDSLVDISGPVLLSANKKDAEVLLKTLLMEMPEESQGLFSMTSHNMLLIHTAIKAIRKEFDKGIENLEHRAKHGPMEMFAITAAYHMVSEHPMISLPSITEWKFQKDIDQDLIDSELGKGFISASQHTDSVPLVDLTEKEFQYIIRYMKRHNYMIPADSEIPQCKVDMIKILNGSRYGTSFMYPVIANGDRMNAHLVFKYEEDHGTLILNLSDGGTNFIISVLFHDMQEFDLYSNIVAVKISYSSWDFKNTPTSADEMDQRIPPEIREVNDILEIVYRVCAMLITIYERPERTRVIRETRKIQKTGEGKKSNELDYVIRRILKTKSEAKSYVSGVSGSSDREYTMESWNRAGHTRQLKSGKIIYISECECHRRLPLSEKEIHLKL